MAVQQKTRKPWVLKRHKVVIEIVRPFMKLYCRIVYGLRVPKARDLIRQQSLILLNHVTPFDQFFVGMHFRDPIYYMATEDIFSNGWVSRLIKWLVNPIPIKKQTTDIKAVMNCIRVVKEGGSICIAPEGNRSYSGKTEYMNPAIAPMARKLGLPIVLFRIDGGYGKEPRWSDVVRGGVLKCQITRTITAEEAKAMSDEALMAAIAEGLYINEARLDREFTHKKLAEYIERAIYVCPECGISEFESHDDVFHCKTCHRQTRYMPDKTLQGINWECPFPFVNDWYEYQKDFVNNLDTTAYTDKPLFEDRADVYKVHVYDKKEPMLQNAKLLLFGDRLQMNLTELRFEDISTVAVLGRNKLNIYHKDELYQLKSHKRFCALKFVNLFYRSRNIARGEGTFLGL